MKRFLFLSRQVDAKMEVTSRASTSEAVLQAEESNVEKVHVNEEVEKLKEIEKEPHPVEEDNESLAVDLISELPAEIVLYILSFVNINDHATLACVSKTFYQYSQDDMLFGNILALSASFRKICRNYRFSYGASPTVNKEEEVSKPEGETIRWDGLVFCSEAMKELRAVVERLLGQRGDTKAEDKKKRILKGKGAAKEGIAEKQACLPELDDNKRFIVTTLDTISNDPRFVLKTIAPCSIPELWYVYPCITSPSVISFGDFHLIEPPLHFSFT